MDPLYPRQYHLWEHNILTFSPNDKNKQFSFASMFLYTQGEP